MLHYIIESFIYNLLYDIPLPSPGRSIRFWSLGKTSNKNNNNGKIKVVPDISFFGILYPTGYSVSFAQYPAGWMSGMVSGKLIFGGISTTPNKIHHNILIEKK